MDDTRRHDHDTDCDGSWIEREALARAAGTPLPRRGGRRPEADLPDEDEVRAAVRTLIRWTGDNPDREGLVDTPDRVARSYREMFAGYDVDPREYLERTFEEVGGYDELIVLKDMEGYLRGREQNEVASLLRDVLREHGLADSRLPMRSTDLDAARHALDWARSGDVLVLPVHARKAKDEVRQLLETLTGSGWWAGEPIPPEFTQE